MFQRKFTLFNKLLFLIPLYLFSQEPILVDLNGFYPDRVEVAGFTLDSEQEITINTAAIKPYQSDRYRPLTESWILDSESRDVVWVLKEAETLDHDGDITTYEDVISLKAGNYEVYYSTFINRYDEEWWGRGRDYPGFFERIFGDAFYDNDWRFSRRDFNDLFITIKGIGQPQDENTITKWQEEIKSSALVEFTNMRDDRYEEQLIEVAKPTEVKVYAIGESRDDGSYDFGWIINISTREKVWDLSYRHSAHAGGAQKNRLSDEKVLLEPGKYKIVYVTDDSHSYRRWNSAPPYDPAFWGVSLWPVTENERGNIVLLEAETEDEKNVIVNFNRVRDRDYLSKGFTLKKPLNLHIYALGEGSEGDMYDYGWIVNNKTHEKVWVMKYRKTEHAGGARKNRVFDGTITLEPGNYIAHYVTDGSHSYRRWNSGRPYDEERWGMRISVLDDNFSENDIADYDEAEDKSILVRITQVGDRDRARANFKLDSDQQVHVYAIGEGVSNEMYDYAWIENASNGRIVWEMSYRKTERAGGARKNRMFDDTVFLEAGEYEVFYETDDSHSFADWNDSPPHDPIHWGITITRIDK